nr:MAG TPA: DNA-directed RNA polymerase [Caudoviricetes sp.]
MKRLTKWAGKLDGRSGKLIACLERRRRAKMNMTKEEAIKSLKNIVEYWTYKPTEVEAAKMAIAALRPVSREQVEKAWRGEWMALDECSNEGVYCKRCKKKVYRIEYANEKMRSPFCPACGRAMTDEAVEMVMERLEALKDGN